MLFLHFKGKERVNKSLLFFVPEKFLSVLIYAYSNSMAAGGQEFNKTLRGQQRKHE